MSSFIRRTMKSLGVLVLAMALVPATASADWLVTPFLGAPFEGEADESHLTYGASFGYLADGILGFELDLGVTPDFFDQFEDSQVVSFMGNLVLAVPESGRGVRPYASAGIGLLRARADSPGDIFTEYVNDDFGFNVGAGLMGFFSDHVGLRGDVRYLRSFQDPDDDLEFDIGVGDFDFWRGTAGVVFRF